jgi:hypothetical protein
MSSPLIETVVEEAALSSTGTGWGRSCARPQVRARLGDGGDMILLTLRRFAE